MNPLLLFAGVCKTMGRRLLTGVSMLLLSTNALAAANEPCQVILSQPGVDFGEANRTLLEQHGGRYLWGKHDSEVTVRCAQAEVIELSYEGQASGLEQYAFGEGAHYALYLSDARLDGNAVMLKGQAGSKGSQLLWKPGVQVVPISDETLLEGRTLTARLTVEAWLDAEAPHMDAQALFAAGTLAVGTSEAPLEIRANLLPTACTLWLGNDGVIDFGRVAMERLSRDQYSELTKHLPLSVQCEAPTRFALRAFDNRASVAPNFAAPISASVLYGIGRLSGAYALSLEQPTSGERGALAAVQRLRLDEQWRLVEGRSYLYPDGSLLGFGRGHASLLGPISLQHLSATLRADLYLPPARQLDLRDEHTIDGAATLEVFYL